jgi:hypothetical protein
MAERCNVKCYKWKKNAHGAKSRKPGAGFQGPPQSSHRIPARRCDHVCEVNLMNENSVDTQCPGWSCRPSCLAYPKNSRLPERKQVFNINHIVCTHSLGIVNHPYHFWEGWETF